MKTPPCNQKHRSSDDSENGSLGHFFTHLVCMRKRLVSYDLPDDDLVTDNSRVIATLNPFRRIVRASAPGRTALEFKA